MTDQNIQIPQSASGLFDPTQQYNLRNYLRRISQLRHYIVKYALASSRSLYRKQLLGRAWHYLEPLIHILIYFFLFGVLVRGFRFTGSVSFLSYMVVGRAAYTMFSSVLQAPLHTVDLSKKFPPHIPRMVLPITRIIKALLLFRYEAIVSLALLLTKDVSSRPEWLFIPFIFTAIIALGSGFGLIFARFEIRFPDVKNIIQSLLRIGFLASGIMVPIEALIDREFGTEFTVIYTYLNPIFALVKLTQWSILGFDNFPLEAAVVSATLYSVTAFAVGFLLFFKAEPLFREGDHK